VVGAVCIEIISRKAGLIIKKEKGGDAVARIPDTKIGRRVLITRKIA